MGEFVFDVPSTMVMAVDDGKENENGSKEDGGTGLVAEIEFFGNYREPNLCLPLLCILHPDDTPQNAVSPQNEPFSINKRPKEDLSPRVRPSGQFVCRLEMDIETKQWTVEKGVALEEHVVRDSFKLSKPDEPWWRQEKVDDDDSKKTPQQLEAARKQREADRARRDAERAKKRLALKTKLAEQKKRTTVDSVADVDHGVSDHQSKQSEK